jgi:hypothetical protein
LAGGRDVYDSLILEIDVYDTATDSWSLLTTWENATSDGVGFGIDGTSDLLFLVGGYFADYSTSAELIVYDVSAGEFITTSSAHNNEEYPSMSVSRGDTQIATLYNNDFYILGGWNAEVGFCSPLTTVEYYSFRLNTWTTVTDMHYPRGDLAAGVLDNMIFAVGGEQKESSDPTCSHSIPVKDVERLLTNDSWIISESIPSGIFRFIGATYNTTNSLYNSAIYLFGGQSEYNNVTMTFPTKNSTLIYYPAAIYHKSSSSKSTLSPGGIAGIVIAGVVVLIVVTIAVVSFCAYRYSKYRYQNLEDADAVSPATAANIDSTNKTKGMTYNDLEDIEMSENFPSHTYRAAGSQQQMSVPDDEARL